MVIDGAAVVVGSENFGRAGYPADPTYGNRGFMVAVHDRDVALAFEAVWADDTNPAHPDLKRWSAADPVLGAPPAGFVPDLSVAGGSHTPVGPPLTIAGPVTVEPVWSPDTSCMQASGPLALVRSATASIDLETMVLQTWWGSTVDTPASAPDLLLEELVQAARRGVRVRVLLDSNPVNVTTTDRRDNDDTVTYLAAAALREGIPIEARPINRPVVGIGWLHNKSMIVDGARTLIASINGSETSFRVNREAGVILDAPAIAAWYGGIFASDWDAGRGGRLARPGDVVFSEVAWAGTLAGAGDEWLELHNNLCVPVNLSGWTVSRNDASSVWTLTGTLPASGDYLVEGREAATSVVSDRVAPLLLANAGDRLELFDGAGTSVDLVNPASGPWPAGDAVARASMERVDPCAPGADPANWRTASGGSGALDAALNPIAGTPGAANSVSRPTCLACLAAELPEVHLVGVLKRSGGARELTWTDVSAVPAFSHYHLYRATVKGSEAAFVRIGGEIAGPGYVDADPGDAFLYVPVAVSTIEKEGPSGVFDGEFDR